MVGMPVLEEATVRTNESLVERMPSVTVTCTVEEPLCVEAGVRLIVQFGAVPARTILALGNKVVSLEEAETLVAQLKVFSASDMEKGRLPVVAS